MPNTPPTERGRALVADERIRHWLRPALEPLAAAAGRIGLRPNHLTVLGLVLALVAAVAAGRGWWPAAASLWLVSRLPDGLDGVLARRDGTASDLGGLFDITADFLAYGGFVLGVAVGTPDARLACAALLLAYYLNGSVFLATSALAERRARRVVDGERSLQFVGGLTEGFETIVAHTLIALVAWAAQERVAVAVWTFAVLVAVTVLQRLRFATQALRDS